MRLGCRRGLFCGEGSDDDWWDGTFDCGNQVAGSVLALPRFRCCCCCRDARRRSGRVGDVVLERRVDGGRGQRDHGCSAGTRAAREERTARRWTLWSAAAGCWLVGQLAWDLFAVVGLPASPNVADVGYWGFAVLVIVSMLRVPGRSRSLRRRHGRGDAAVDRGGHGPDIRGAMARRGALVAAAARACCRRWSTPPCTCQPRS